MQAGCRSEADFTPVCPVPSPASMNSDAYQGLAEQSWPGIKEMYPNEFRTEKEVKGRRMQ